MSTLNISLPLRQVYDGYRCVQGKKSKGSKRRQLFGCRTGSPRRGAGKDTAKTGKQAHGSGRSSHGGSSRGDLRGGGDDTVDDAAEVRL